MTADIRIHISAMHLRGNYRPGIMGVYGQTSPKLKEMIRGCKMMDEHHKLEDVNEYSDTD